MNTLQKKKKIQIIIWLVIILFINISTSGLAQITRTQIINNAVPYTSCTWTAGSCNLWNNLSCGSKTVKYASWVVAGSNTSMPYCWGGWSTIADHNTAMTNCKSAGDINTTGDGAGLGCASGHDCSGFVSRAWGLSYKYSTSTIPNISTAKFLSDTQPGDVVNLAASHVRLIETNYGNGNYRVIEASGSDWKTAYHSYTASQLSSYTPRCYNNVSGGCISTAPPSNDDCSNAVTLTSGVNINYTMGNVLNATYSGVTKPLCDSAAQPNMFDVWYKFTALYPVHTIIVAPYSSLGDPVVSVYNSCNGSLITCSDTGKQGVTENITLTNLTPGNTYYIRVYNYGSVLPTGVNAYFYICVMHNVNTSVGKENIPEGLILHQNYPNPFNPSTKIIYEIPNEGNVSLVIYNILGEKVTELVNSFQSAGSYSVDWNASNMQSGIYFYELRFHSSMKNSIQVHKMLLIK